MSRQRSNHAGSAECMFRPEVREAYRRLVAQGWTDALRALHPGERIYTFWDYFRNAYGRDAGLRIDHLLLSPALAGRLKATGVDRGVRGWDRASDHAPTWIDHAPGARRHRDKAHRNRLASREGRPCSAIRHLSLIETALKLVALEKDFTLVHNRA